MMEIIVAVLVSVALIVGAYAFAYGVRYLAFCGAFALLTWAGGALGLFALAFSWGVAFKWWILMEAVSWIFRLASGKGIALANIQKQLQDIKDKLGR